MSSDNIDQEFKDFLANNKIDTTSLAGTKEEKNLFNVQDQRVMGIVRAVRSLFHKCIVEIVSKRRFSNGKL